MSYQIYEVNPTVIARAQAVAQEKGWELLKIRKYDDNPLNGYLSFVLCKRAENDYCTHLFNHSREEDNGYFAEGHYDIDSYGKALDDLFSR